MGACASSPFGDCRHRHEKEGKHKMQILRMENSKLQGPFNPDVMHDPKAQGIWKNVPWIEDTGFGLHSLDLDHEHHFTDCMPMSGREAYVMDLYGVRPLRGDWLVGCKDRSQFLHWFPEPSLPDFEAGGMRLDIWECPKQLVRFGEYQVMFPKDSAELVQSRPLVSLASAREMLADLLETMRWDDDGGFCVGKDS